MSVQKLIFILGVCSKSTKRLAKIWIFPLVIGLVIGGCGSGNVAVPNDGVTKPIENTDPKVEKPLGEIPQFVVLGNSAIEEKIENRSILPIESPEAKSFLSPLANSSLIAKTTSAPQSTLRDDSLTLAFPIGLLGERFVFGGVVTKLNDKESETLGRLKLADLPPLHVRAVVVRTKGDSYVFGLAGCASKCTETSEEVLLTEIPVIAVDTKQGLLLLDLAAIGDKMNLIEALDPKGDYTKLKTKTSKTIAFDYSVSTLVFDVQVSMVPTADPKAPQNSNNKIEKETVFTIRWYLRLNSVFNPSFEVRNATPGLGFFMTGRAASPKIERHSLSLKGASSQPSIKYYIKNVPNEHKAAFQAAFDSWNEKFVEISGKKLISYEFIDAKDPRSSLLNTGDIRYKIVEWDLDNRAPYGGLGPSIANQFTGEILSSNVLVQGPHIVKIYRAWFEVAKRAELLREEGREEEAQAVLRDFNRDLKTSTQAGESRVELSLSPELAFKVHSQTEALEDPAMQREDFDLLPEGFTFESYMEGYFHELVGHELGHNLGLRHNFRGNLFAEPGEAKLGKVSISIMEYLGRRFRYLDRIGSYDVMALKYGYLGVPPERKDQFCTDEDVPTDKLLTASAECSRDDASSDPFAFLENRLRRATDLIIGRELKTAPVWTVDDMDRELKGAVLAMGMYAATAEKSAQNWTHFFLSSDRPKTIPEVKPFVIAKLLGTLCPSDLALVIASKSSTDAKAATEKNVISLLEKAKALLAPLKILVASELSCGAREIVPDAL